MKKIGLLLMLCGVAGLFSAPSLAIEGVKNDKVVIQIIKPKNPPLPPGDKK